MALAGKTDSQIYRCFADYLLPLIANAKAAREAEVDALKRELHRGRQAALQHLRQNWLMAAFGLDRDA